MELNPFRDGGLLIFLLLTTAVASFANTSPNLVPNPELRVDPDGRPMGWTLVSPRPEVAPVGSVVERGGAMTLSLRARTPEVMGRWSTVVRAVEPGRYYKFEGLHQTDRVLTEAVSVYATLTWCRDEAGSSMIQRDYIAAAKEATDWRRSRRTLQAPEGTRSVRVDLGFKWAPGGAVFWKHPRLEEVSAPPPRKVRIATTHLVPADNPTIASNTKLIADMFDRMGPARPDVVLFSENFNTRGVVLSLAKKSQTIPGPLTDMLAEKARRYSSYVITTLNEVDGDRYHNTAVLIDREGRLVGKYRKVHLTIGESESGLTPGNEYPVYETDFGRIGILTCWDNWFSEPARILRLKGAEMAFMPLAGDADNVHWDVIWKARAIDNGIWLVTSSTVAESPSRIIDPVGTVLADVMGTFEHALVEVDLNQEWRLMHLSVGKGLGESRSLMIKERRPDTYEALGDPLAVGAIETKSTNERDLSKTQSSTSTRARLGLLKSSRR